MNKANLWYNDRIVSNPYLNWHSISMREIFFKNRSMIFIYYSKTSSMKFLFALFLIPLLMVPAFAETQTLPTDKNTLDVKLTYDPIEPNVLTKINIDFINPQTQKVQEHIDYTIAVSKDGETVFGPIPLTHTSLGSVKIPIEFNLGEGGIQWTLKLKEYYSTNSKRSCIF